eukprot:scaffold3305_cov328-Pinguiococcus_pyrenoidosus.AAC.1
MQLGLHRSDWFWNAPHLDFSPSFAHTRVSFREVSTRIRLSHGSGLYSAPLTSPIFSGRNHFTAKLRKNPPKAQLGVAGPATTWPPWRHVQPEPRAARGQGLAGGGGGHGLRGAEERRGGGGRAARLSEASDVTRERLAKGRRGLLCISIAAVAKLALISPLLASEPEGLFWLARIDECSANEEPFWPSLDRKFVDIETQWYSYRYCVRWEGQSRRCFDYDEHDSDMVEAAKDAYITCFVLALVVFCASAWHLVKTAAFMVQAGNKTTQVAVDAVASMTGNSATSSGFFVLMSLVAVLVATRNNAAAWANDYLEDCDGFSPEVVTLGYGVNLFIAMIFWFAFIETPLLLGFAKAATQMREQFLEETTATVATPASPATPTATAAAVPVSSPVRQPEQV